MIIKISKIISNVFLNICIILLGLITLTHPMMLNNQPIMNDIFKFQAQIIENVGEDELEDVDSEYFKSDYTSVSELKAAGLAKCAEIEAEGAVLLKNDNNALPLGTSAQVSLFSVSSVDPVYAGAGSGGANTAGAVNFKQAIEATGMKINTDLWDFYSSNLSTYGRKVNKAASGFITSVTIGDAYWSDIPASARANSEFGDAAIFIISRTGGEGRDLDVKITEDNSSGIHGTNGNYLALSPREISVLEGLKAEKDNGTFKSIVVIINAANQFECDFLLDDAKYGIDSALWIGSPGVSGLTGVGQILAGTVNPSGKLSDTFWTKHHYNPVMANFVAYDGRAYSYAGTQPGNTNAYVVYQEGVYLGYKYTETRYEDVVMGTANTGTFNYKEVVAYPFGFGLSYTSFAYSGYDVTVATNAAGRTIYTATVEVENTGTVAGKDVVEIYIQKPFTAYDKANDIEKPSVELVGFAKTKLLAAGEKQTLTVEIDEKYFASFDATGAGTYYLDDGDYYLAMGNGAHEAVNNILLAKGNTLPAGESGNVAFAKKFSLALSDEDKTKYSVSEATGNKIKSLFDFTDINRYSGRGDNSVTYITRTNWQGTVKYGLDPNTNEFLSNQVVLTKTVQMGADQKYNYIYDTDDREYPKYGVPAYGTSPDGTEKFKMLIEMKGVAYDDPLWDEFMDQVTWDETKTLLMDGFRRTLALPKLGKPLTFEPNGPIGFDIKYNDGGSMANRNKGRNAGRGLANEKSDPNMFENAVCYPCNGILAATFNVELARETGKLVGEDGLWAGANGIYGTGLNTHRVPYEGRAFEYYSEDGILGGLVSAGWCEGIESMGVYVYNKHFALNDVETNRGGLCTWTNEQALREIYLRQFELAITEGGASNVMTAFNRFGVVWSGSSKALMTDFLRLECGMSGFAVTDWWSGGYMNLPAAVLAGNDLPDGVKSGTSGVQGDVGTVSATVFDPFQEEHGEMAWAMRESVKRIMYTVLNSNAMNGFTSTTKITILTPPWIDTINDVKTGIQITFGIALVANIGLRTFIFIKKREI